MRVDPTRQGGPAQSIAAKVDFAVQSDDAESVMIYWPPDMLYFDARYSPAGQMGAGMWGNKETIVFRAPADEFERWLPILSIIQGSVRLNSQWMAGELRGQIQRGEIALQTQQAVT